MESCDYKCRPDKEIKDEDVRLDTYNEDFIMMNNDKLIYKIKQLMKERFFYRKSELVTLLNILKPYPLVQINAALHQLVEDKNEYITDKYDRLGNLINIADLYLFQPLELKNTRSSIHDRTIPLEVKNDKIHMILPKELKVNEAIINIQDIPAEVQKLALLHKTLETNYLMATSPQEISKGEKNWYMFCYRAMELLKKNGLNEQILHYLIAEHMVDELPLADIIVLLNQYEVNPLYNTSAAFKHIKTYINKQILTGRNGLKGFLWKSGGKLSVLVKTKDLTWNLAESEDLKDLEERMNEKKTDILTNLNKLIGFTNNFKTENYVVFKTKDITNPRDLGARCDQNSNKSKAIEILNTIIGKNVFSTQLDIPQREICVLQEFYARSFELERKDRKHWFLSPPESVLTNIEKYTTVIKAKKKQVREKKG